MGDNDFAHLFEAMERNVAFICVTKALFDESVVIKTKKVKFNAALLAANSDLFSEVFNEKVRHVAESDGSGKWTNNTVDLRFYQVLGHGKKLTKSKLWQNWRSG